MLQIDFYLLATSDAHQIELFICEWIEKLYRQNRKIYILTEDQHRAHLLDEALWSSNPTSFIPHCLLGEGPVPAPNIILGYDPSHSPSKDILFNVSGQIPLFFKQFNQIFEMVPHTPEHLERARHRYRSYKQQHACTIHHHDLRKADVHDQ